MEVFVHTRGKDVELYSPNPTTTARDFAEQVGHPDGHIFVEGQDTAVEPDSTLEDAGIPDRANIHVGACKKVIVSVRYNQQERSYEVPPAVPLESVYARAASTGQGFGLSDADRVQFTLQIQGAAEQPDLSRHVGAFANDNCTAAFDLVMQDRFQG